MEEKMTVSYTRISEEDLEKLKEFSVSIYNQLSLIKDYAERMNLKIDKEYIDDGFSGGNFDRPGFEELLNDIDKGKISTIITKDLSRLGRDFIETSYYIFDFFPKHNIRYIAINDCYDSDDENNTLDETMIAIKNVINDRYIHDSSIKRKQVAEAKTNNGEFIGFIAPYGYKVVKKDNKRTLEIDEYSSMIVKRIFTNIASGKSREEVAQELNEDKILPPVIYMNMTPSRNKKYYYDWSDKIVYRILKNETYTGNTVIRKSEKRNYKQKKRNVIPIRDREVIKNTHPAIISETLFKEANSKLKTLKRKEKNDYDGTFSGLVICGECGRVMTACRTVKDSGNVKYYFACTKVENRKKCPNRVLYDNKLRNIIEENLKDLIMSFGNDKMIIGQVTKELHNKERYNLKVSNLKKEIELYNINIRNLYLQKTKGEIDLQEFVRLKKEQTDLKTKCENELLEIKETSDINKIKTEVSKAYNGFINRDILLKEYIREIIEKIVIHKDNTIQIVYKFGISTPRTIKLF